jgi:streptolysin S family bacteriocin protoxin
VHMFEAVAMARGQCLLMAALVMILDAVAMSISPGGCWCWLCCCCIAEAVGQSSKSKESRMFLSGGFSGGRTLLGSDPRSQSFFFANALHFIITVRKFAFVSAGIFSFDTSLIAHGQLS